MSSILAALSIFMIAGCAAGGSGVQPDLVVNPSIISAGSVTLGDSKTQVVTLTNAATAPLIVEGAALIGNGFKVLGLSLPLSLGSGQSFNFSLQFTPTSVGTLTGSLSLVSNARHSPFNIALSGTGVTDAATPISISVAPTAANIPAGTSLQFTATVSGSSNTGVTWSVNGMVGGSTTLGGISSTGIYTAPAAPPSPATVTVTATSTVSSSAKASSVVMLTDAATPVSISVAPTAANIPAGTSLQFTAIVSGSPNTDVTWSVNGIVGGSLALGTISSTGIYTAPAVPPSPATVTVTATSTVSSSATASSTVKLLANSTPPVTGAPSSGPVLNVLDSGATVNTNIDATAAINSTVSTLPASGGTVYLPAGTYAIKSAVTPLIINRAKVTFECAPGAVLQAQTGFLLGFPILEIRGSATDVLVQGCVFDGNGISGQGFQIDASAASIIVDQVETKNHTQNGGRGSLRTGELLQITNSYFHDVPTGFYDLAGVGGNPSLKLDNNRFDRITGKANGIAAGASGLSSFEASENAFTDITAGTQQVLYCYGCDKVDWEHNSFDNVFGAVHCDTCGGGIISYNTATNSTGGPDFFAEVGSNFILQGNASTNAAGERGIVLGVGSNTQGPASLRAQVASFDSTKGFVAGPNASLSTDTTDKQEGTGSMVVAANSSFTTGTLWYFDFEAAQTSWVPYQEIWIKPTSTALSAGQLQLCMSLNTAISTCDLPVDLPAVAHNTWYHVITYANGWEGAVSINGQSSPGFKSFGIRVTTSSPGLVVKFDDFDKATELVGYVAQSNKIVNPGASCIFLGALEGGTVSDNYCENPGTRSNTAYNDENSAGVTFTGNQSSFSTTASGTVHLHVDGLASTASVTASGDVTNAATKFLCTNGGKVITGP